VALMPRKSVLFGYPVAGLLCLLVTYVVWGSTYLAIRIAVREGAGWGPFWLGASRVFVAAAILLLVCSLRKVRIRPTGAELVVIAGSGVLMWVGGNGAVNWAETRIDSGLAALVVGAMPMWVVLMESVIDHRRPSTRLMASLGVGFAGLGVLTLPMWREGLHGDLAGVAAAVVAAISWGAGSVWLNRRPVGVDSVTSAGLQQLFGGFGFLAMVALVAEPLPRPSGEGWGAFVYLVLFGSVLAFTCFIYALKTLPTTLVMTYSYVNPVIAVFLGWLLIDEPVTAETFAGTVLIIAGVWGVFRDKADGGQEES
jgi:drug/metabolite transporter (DMT)-like permease